MTQEPPTPDEHDRGFRAAEPDSERPPGRSPLTRSSSDKVIGGVAGGLGAYFGVDPVLFRIGFAVSILFGGLGLIAYLVALAFLPTDDGPALVSGGSRGATIAVVAALAVAAVAFLGPPLFVFGPGVLALALLAVVGVLLWRALGGGRDEDPARTIARAALACLVLVAALGAAVGVGILAALGGGVAIAVGAIVAGVALIAAGLFGGPRWLILPAIVLVLPLAVVSAAGLDLHGGVGQRAYRVADAASLRPEYRLGVGQLDLDLRQLHLPAGHTNVKVDVGLGEALVHVPADMCVSTDARVGVGDANLLDREDSGFDVDIAEPASTRTAGVLHLNADVGAGHLQVMRDGTGTCA